MLSDKSVIEWASGWLNTGRVVSDVDRARFLNGLQAELEQRAHLLALERAKTEAATQDRADLLAVVRWYAADKPQWAIKFDAERSDVPDERGRGGKRAYEALRVIEKRLAGLDAPAKEG